MGRKHRKLNPFAQKKREKKLGLTGKPDKRSEPYEEIVRDNELFLKYYKHQKVCPENEWDSFVEYIRRDLPTTFRITAYRGEAKTLLNMIKSEYFNEYLKGAAELERDDAGDKPIPLPWYPNEYAWQLQLTRKDIRRSESFYKLHNFLIAETNAGSISRQEAVSMIPPLVLDVQPHHKVLDMCAAPGSKTAQLIEALHADNDSTIPSGFVVANDIDNNRCYMLVHQAKRLNSPCFIVTNHDSANLPNFIVTNTETGAKEELKFDRVLCDVPCSGDGTLRKNPDIWLKWNNGQSSNLHGIQYRIAKRGAEMLTVGGKLVYSTCSLNPIENEAVLHRLIRESDGALEIIDAKNSVPGLKYYPGMTYWEPATKDVQCFKQFADVPEKYHTIIRPQMFPPNPEDAAKFNLDKCFRILPHLQDTGAFFVAVLQKKKLLPWEKESKYVAPKAAKEEAKPESMNTENGEDKKETSSENKTDDQKTAAVSAPWGPQRKRKRVQGYKEDPYIFFKENEPVWSQLKSFYLLSDEFEPTCLLTRSESEKKKTIYFCSKAVRDLLICNQDSIKIINTGVKTFVRCDNRNMKCSFRLANEGLPSINYMIGATRRLNICRDDLIILLNNTTPTQPPLLNTLTEETQNDVKNLGAGSCVLHCTKDDCSITLVGWRGTNSLRAYTDSNDTVHLLRLLGADLSKYDINKFLKNKETAEEKLEDDEVEKLENDEVENSAEVEEKDVEEEVDL